MTRARPGRRRTRNPADKDVTTNTKHHYYTQGHNPISGHSKFELSTFSIKPQMMVLSPTRTRAINVSHRRVTFTIHTMRTATIVLNLIRTSISIIGQPATHFQITLLGNRIVTYRRFNRNVRPIRFRKLNLLPKLRAYPYLKQDLLHYYQIKPTQNKHQ